MKATDLMIGDWVVYNGDVEYINPIRIEGMDIATDMLITSDREDVGFDGVEPIPLTTEILEKNGFESMPNIGYKLDDYSGNAVTYDFWNNKLKILTDYSVVFERSYFDTIAVHELQHVLRLCGIIKEIEL